MYHAFFYHAYNDIWHTAHRTSALELFTDHNSLVPSPNKLPLQPRAAFSKYANSSAPESSLKIFLGGTSNQIHVFFWPNMILRYYLHVILRVHRPVKPIYGLLVKNPYTSVPLYHNKYFYS